MRLNVHRALAPGERTIAAWVPAEMAERIAELAVLNERSISGEVRLALREHLSRASEDHSLIRR